MKVSALAYAGLLAFAQVAKTQDTGDDVKDNLDDIGDNIKDIGDNIGDGLGDAFDNVKGDVDNFIDEAKSNGGSAWSELRASATADWDKVKQSYSNIIATATGEAAQQASEYFESASGEFQNAIASASSIAEDAGNNDDDEDAGVMQAVSLGLTGLAAGVVVFINL